ncbi:MULTISPECIES: hypothetical protein [unclassified Kitasatospora]|uniref:hypothetical protein n=1 Tax=unclassified Kitasatospora TaxID=2633591 RepID=UPI00070FCA71|nr:MULTISPECIES: hypothetical protein [unclassified Kitasatospora]KQV24149.1 hypothetical protein ASC99_02870 [Kitasatospora sp. Root107]KRB67136.1 hypothetical protein ASE03_01870 [Kitasatospora sp. Root187]
MSSSTTTDRGDGLVRAGGIVFLVGAVGAIVTFVPLFFDLTPLPSVAYWISMLMPAGFLLALSGLFLSARKTNQA